MRSSSRGPAPPDPRVSLQGMLCMPPPLNACMGAWISNTILAGGTLRHGPGPPSSIRLQLGLHSSTQHVYSPLRTTVRSLQLGHATRPSLLMFMCSVACRSSAPGGPCILCDPSINSTSPAQLAPLSLLPFLPANEAQHLHLPALTFCILLPTPPRRCS